MAAVTVNSDFGAQENKICHCFHFSIFCLPWSDGTDALILVFWILSFKPDFSLSSFTLIKRLFSLSSLSAIRVILVSSAYLRLLIFLPCEQYEKAKKFLLRMSISFFNVTNDAGKDWGQEEKGMTEDEMVGWHHWLDGHGFGWTLGVGDGQGGLVCWSSWGLKESNMTERLNWTELNWLLCCKCLAKYYL